MTLPEVPPPDSQRNVPKPDRPVALVAVLGGGGCLLAVIVGLTVLGWHEQGANDVAMTGLAAIGSALAGGFAGWIGRGAIRRDTEEEDQ